MSTIGRKRSRAASRSQNDQEDHQAHRAASEQLVENLQAAQRTVTQVVDAIDQAPVQTRELIQSQIQSTSLHFINIGGKLSEFVNHDEYCSTSSNDPQMSSSSNQNGYNRKPAKSSKTSLDLSSSSTSNASNSFVSFSGASSSSSNSHSSPFDGSFASDAMTDEQLAHYLMAEEQNEQQMAAERKRQRQEQEERDFLALMAAESTCVVCQNQLDPESVFETNEQCCHRVCKKCLRTGLLHPTNPTSQQCPVPSCTRVVSMSCKRWALSADEIANIETRSVQTLLKSSGHYVECPSCHAAYEAVESTRGNNGTPREVKPVIVDGVELSPEHAAHRDAKRFLCPGCQVDFCRDCNVHPYHNGYLCEAWRAYQAAPKCRFCSEVITESEQLNVKGRGRSKKITAPVCSKSDCVMRAAASCGIQLKCKHWCCGIKSEKPCLGCLVDECPGNTAKADGEDFCNICYTESLSAAPSIKLECGHLFHLGCVDTKISKRWSGQRIVFSYLDCPLCKVQMKHPSLAKRLTPHWDLQKRVKDKAIARLSFEGAAQDPPLQKGGRYEGRPEAYAMDRFAYYECSECKEPYYGGKRACEGLQADNEAQPNAGEHAVNANAAAELVCPTCVMKKTGESGCKKHGTEYIEFKCKFCCGIAAFFCFGTTHFCDPCHLRQERGDYLTRKPLNQLPQCEGGAQCPLKISKHPKAGQEFALGCALCREP